MLNKLYSFHSYVIIKIQTFIDVYYIFYKYLNILGYITKLLKKNRFFYDNIENKNNTRNYHRDFVYKLTNYIKIWGQFLVLIIFDIFVIIFYKAIQNSRVSINIATSDFFGFFYFKILAFLFAIVYYDINKHQDGGKILNFFDKKTV